MPAKKTTALLVKMTPQQKRTLERAAKQDSRPTSVWLLLHGLAAADRQAKE